MKHRKVMRSWSRAALTLAVGMVISFSPALASVAEAAAPSCNSSAVKKFALGKSQSSIKSAGTMTYKKYLTVNSWMMGGKTYGVSAKKPFTGTVRFYVNKIGGGTSGQGVVCSYTKSGRVKYQKSFNFKSKPRQMFEKKLAKSLYHAVVIKADGGYSSGRLKYEIKVKHKAASSAEINRARAAQDLGKLFKKSRLSVSEIKKARGFIAKLSSADRGDQYVKLQEKVKYSNQRDNDISYEKPKGGSCFVTSVAMAAKYLGIENPNSSKQMEESLDDLRISLGLTGSVDAGGGKKVSKILLTTTWKAVIKNLKPSLSWKNLEGVGKNKRGWWESEVRDKYLRKGYGVVMSLQGHVVRVQSVTSAGLTLDDPYGQVGLKAGKGLRFGKYKTGAKGNNGKGGEGSTGWNNGENVLHSWSDVEKHQMKWIAVFK